MKTIAWIIRVAWAFFADMFRHHEAYSYRHQVTVADLEPGKKPASVPVVSAGKRRIPVIDEDTAPIRRVKNPGKRLRTCGFSAMVIPFREGRARKARFFTRAGELLTAKVVAIRGGKLYLRRGTRGPIFSRLAA